RIRRRDPKLIRIELHRALHLDSSQLSAQTGVLRLFGEQRSGLRGLDFVYTSQQLFDRAELCDQLNGGLLTDAFYPWDIVRGIAHQAHDLDDPCRLHAEPLATF